MKKVNLLLFYIIFIIYEELVLSLLLFSAFPSSIGLIALFSIPIAIILSFISNILISCSTINIPKVTIFIHKGLIITTKIIYLDIRIILARIYYI